MEKAWLKSYPNGVPAEIDINEFKYCKRWLNELGQRPQIHGNSFKAWARYPCSRWSRARRASATTRSSRPRSGVTRLRVVMRRLCSRADG